MCVPLVRLNLLLLESVLIAFALSCCYDNATWWQRGGIRMASLVPLLPPEKFNFAHPDSWPQWIKRFERYRVASGLSDRDGPVPVSTLIYAMGEEAEEIFSSFELQEADSSNYSRVKDYFAKHFVKRHNPIYERARFNQRLQQQGETVDSFLTALHSLAEHCEYGTLRNQMIRDSLVVGLLDANLSERLQLEADLKLEDVIARARNSEVVKGQQATVRSTATSSTHVPAIVDAVRSRPGGKHPCQFPRHNIGARTARNNRRMHYPPPARKCGWCGKDQHPREHCPARKAKCRHCSKIGHFAAVCRSSASDASAAVSELKEEAFLGALDFGPAWTRQIFVNGVPIEMKLDTGADVTAIPETTYQKMLQSKPSLAKPNRLLRGPDGRKLSVQGLFETLLSTTKTLKFDHSSRQTVYVVRGLQLPLLGRPAIAALHLFSQIDAIPPDTRKLSEAQIYTHFSRLFSGLGEFRGRAHRIHLRANAIPYSLTTPRRVPLPMRDRVAAELKRMETLGVIRKVDEPTDWCAGMVVVPKANGSIRICCDLTRLNDSVL